METHFWPLQQFSATRLIAIDTAQRKWNQMLVWSARWKWPGQIRKHEATASIHMLFVSPSDVWLELSFFIVNIAETNPLIDFYFPPTDFR